MGSSDRAVGLLIARILGGNGQLAQLWFRASVLDRYRHVRDAKIMRTNSVGRLKLAQWSVDFGIVDPADAGQSGQGLSEALVHIAVHDAQDRIPDSEREHWASHAVTLPVSTNFLLMQLTRGSCIDDGDLRVW
jgi:hypothetical protein